MLKAATNQEVGYRQAGGKHSLEERSLSPIVIPSSESTPGPRDKLDSDVSGTEEEKDTEEEEEEEEKKKRRKSKMGRRRMMKL